MLLALVLTIVGVVGMGCQLTGLVLVYSCTRLLVAFSRPTVAAAAAAAALSTAQTVAGALASPSTLQVCVVKGIYYCCSAFCFSLAWRYYRTQVMFIGLFPAGGCCLYRVVH